MFFDIIGWMGMILVSLAYALLSTNKISNGRLYHTLNLIAAIFMGIGLYPKDAWFSFALQVVWGCVAIAALIKLIRGSKKGERI